MHDVRIPAGILIGVLNGAQQCCCVELERLNGEPRPRIRRVIDVALQRRVEASQRRVGLEDL